MANGPIIFASDDSPDAMIDALAYIKKYNLTRDDVALKVSVGQTLIYAKRNIMEKLRA